MENQTQNQSKKYKFYVHGMHCNACVLLTESELKDHALVENAVANLKNCCVEVVGDFKDRDEKEIAEELSSLIEKHGYKISIEKENKKGNWSEFKIALPVALAFLILFVLLQKIGLVNLINSSSVTYGTAFAIGIIASLSTCMAVVGGLLLSLSATFAKGGDKVRPQIMFHVGRIISFFILGGVIGAIGGAFTLNASASFAISLIIGIVMLILGINLLDIFPWAKKLTPSMPKFITSRAHFLSKNSVSKYNHTLTPFLVGIATFFLPCGFTQSMQLYTLTTGSFLNGGLTMLSFALGTLLVLGLISFSSFGIQNSSKSGVFFKSAGLIVIMFAIFNLVNSLVAIGFISPIFNI